MSIKTSRVNSFTHDGNETFWRVQFKTTITESKLLSEQTPLPSNGVEVRFPLTVHPGGYVWSTLHALSRLSLWWRAAPTIYLRTRVLFSAN